MNWKDELENIMRKEVQEAAAENLKSVAVAADINTIESELSM